MQVIRPFLEQAEWNLQTALENYFTATAEEQNDSEYDPNAEPDFEDAPQVPASSAQQGIGGGRTLGGEGVESRYVPGQPPAASSSSSRQPASRAPQRGGMRTLRDLQRSGDDSGHGHAHDEDDEDEKDQDLFAGGEKSGLAVQNPRSSDDQVNDIIKRAQRNAPRPGGEDDTGPPRPTRFTGRGQTLGGDDEPSTVIEPSQPTSSNPPPRVHRDLHLWRDGFSVDDGPLFRFDDPANAATLEMINRGRAPLDLLNVQQGQEVDLQVHPHRDEDYKPPKKKYQPFSGKGQRLGSPVPAVEGVASSSSSTAPAPATTSAAAQPPQAQIDESAPIVTLQIRLGDGTSLRSRFNTTHTIGDVYGFVDAASTASQRPYVLMTTFPSKELSDKSAVLGDLAEFKRGGTLVQKWT
ncbi:SEP-domain-containing protein [Rhizodiscina lignyota]|uniref:SEP-domain-containing protein n=1 Tax=Rhizodiscina lignyota TaxID=1504668 RepID=A0A9P4I8J2_9PEZI|nr:SEP-domain-containing protein [Rhizodiscina lignyota]